MNFNVFVRLAAGICNSYIAAFLLKTVYPSVVTVEDNNIVFDTSGMIFSYFFGKTREYSLCKHITSLCYILVKNLFFYIIVG